MANSRLDLLADRFRIASESLLARFVSVQSDLDCSTCHSAGFEQALLAAWLQEQWSQFSRDFVIASTQGTRRKSNPVKSLPGVRTLIDAEKTIKPAASDVATRHGLSIPIWHAPWFVIEVSMLVGLRNVSRIEATFGPTNIPAEVSDFRNYLVHPNTKTKVRYDALQAKYGLFDVEPAQFTSQEQSAGLSLFHGWIQGLQRVAHDVTA